MTYPLRVTRVLLCAKSSDSELVDTWLEVPGSDLGFYVLEIERELSIHFGVHEGEPWYRWIWMWDSTREADLALAQVPPNVESCLDDAILAVQVFIIGSMPRGVDSSHAARMDITPLLAPWLADDRLASYEGTGSERTRCLQTTCVTPERRVAAVARPKPAVPGRDSGRHGLT